MKRKSLAKILTMTMIASIVTSLCPATLYAATGNEVAKDGTYTSTKHVTDEGEQGWSEYNVEVSVSVSGGKIKNIEVTPDESYDSESNEFYDWAKDGRTKKNGTFYPGYSSLVDKDATEDTIKGWDSVSGATCTSKAVKEALLEAINSAPVAGSETEAVKTENLKAAIAAARELKESDYTAESWASMQTALTAAEAALTAESQDAVDKATTALNDAVAALVKADEYTYVYAGLSWAEYWAAEGVQAAGSTATSDEADSRGEYDKGAFDTVTRATTSHGLHRGSFQCNEVIKAENGKEYNVSYWTDKENAVLTDGSKINFKKGTITEESGDTTTMTEYDVLGLKYVPVKVKTSDLADLKASHRVIENGSTLEGGCTEENLVSYTGLTANVTENTNGLKTATKNEDGGFSFSAKVTGTESGIKDQALKTAPSAEEVGLTVKDAKGSYGEFLRVDLTKNSVDLGSNMQTVTWKYYGDDDTYQNVKATYGTKFAADNWMHKSKGIQLTLTKSARCTLPEGTDGTGYWTITISALGYEDVTYQFQATSKNVVGAVEKEVDTAKLEAAIAKAESLKESDYTAASWAAMQTELGEAKDELAAKHSQAAVDEATEHLNAAINALEKAAVENEYTYVYAGLSWAEYWAAEDVQAAGDATSSKDLDSKGELDKGAFDTVTRATTNHGLHRGSFQCNAVIKAENGKEYNVSYWESDGIGKTAVLTDGSKIKFEKGAITELASGETTTMTEYDVLGLKYVPVKVKTSDLEALKASHRVIENGSTLEGGYTENKLNGYTGLIANVTENTNGLKTATKKEDGSFSFSAKAAGTESGIKDQALKTAPTAEAAGLTVTPASKAEPYGCFLRVDLTGDYGDLGSNMQTVTWKYYGDDSTYQDVKATYGTKFAADNWMHKSMGIQLGLTDSLRCQLPAGTDGTGNWTVTIGALGYEDVTYKFQTTSENIVPDSDEEISTTALEAAIAKAEGLKESDYTAASWANMQTELGEAKDELAAKHSQAAVDEATEHLNAAIAALEKVEQPATVDTAALETAISESEKLKETDYTAESWTAYQAALQSARAALEVKESQEAVDAAKAALDAAKAGLVKASDSNNSGDNGNNNGADNGNNGSNGNNNGADNGNNGSNGNNNDANNGNGNTNNNNSNNGNTTTTTDNVNGTVISNAEAAVSPATGDVAGNVASGLGWLGLALSSLGAGLGGEFWKRKKRK